MGNQPLNPTNIARANGYFADILAPDFLGFLRRRWLIILLRRIIFPVPVTWNRALAPLCVFSLGIFYYYVLFATFFNRRPQNDGDSSAFHARRGFQPRLLPYFLRHPF